MRFISMALLFVGVLSCGIKHDVYVHSDALKIDDKFYDLVSKLGEGLSANAETIRKAAIEVNASVDQALAAQNGGKAPAFSQPMGPFEEHIIYLDKGPNPESMALRLMDSPSDYLDLNLGNLEVISSAGTYKMVSNQSQETNFKWWFKKDNQYLFVDIKPNEATNRFEGILRSY